MRIAIAVGDFTPGEANELRRHMGAWSMKGDMGPWITRLATGMRRNGLAEDFIQSILAQMKGFAHYGFPESHAVSFALLAYASSYLKCHFPAAFFMAVLNSQPMGFYAPHALLQAAQRDGVKILPVSAKVSEWDSTLENIAEPGRPPRWALRLGFRLVTGLRRVGADLLVARRAAAGGFSDLDHFLKTAPLHRGDVTALAAADALADFGLPRRAALWVAEAAPFCERLEDVDETPAFAPETAMERAEQDFAAAHTTLGPHPVVIIREQHWCYKLPKSRLLSAQALASAAPGKSVDVFGMILVRQSPPSAKGMVFFTMEDETGFINLAFTPEQYAKFYTIVERQSFLCIRGKLQRQNEYHSVMVTEVHIPEMERAEVLPLNGTVTKDDPDRVDPREELPMDKVLQPARNYM
jgi:error-prone DNA polymerase